MTRHIKFKRSSIETFPRMLRILDTNKAFSPNTIAKKINSDKRTVEKMLKVGEQLKMIKCDTIRLGKRTYRACRLRRKFW